MECSLGVIAAIALLFANAVLILILMECSLGTIILEILMMLLS